MSVVKSTSLRSSASNENRPTSSCAGLTQLRMCSTARCPAVICMCAAHAAADVEEDAEADRALVAGLELDDLPELAALEDLEVLAAEIVDGPPARIADHRRHRDDVDRGAEGRRLRQGDARRRRLEADRGDHHRRCAHPRKPCVTSSHGASLLQRSCQSPQVTEVRPLIGFGGRKCRAWEAAGAPKMVKGIPEHGSDYVKSFHSSSALGLESACRAGWRPSGSGNR